jgi:hypothetical protein
MSLDHIKEMLETLKQYDTSEILLTFNNKKRLPLLSVCYENNCYQITYLDRQFTDIYVDIESTISAINKVMQDGHQKTSIY